MQPMTGRVLVRSRRARMFMFCILSDRMESDKSAELVMEIEFVKEKRPAVRRALIVQKMLFRGIRVGKVCNVP